jgi:putative ubiquitin-RnfH superfamily antitoxin RatB of RatAB toxin-antitoxin module
MEVEVCYAEVDQAWRKVVVIAPGSTLADALAQSMIESVIAADPKSLGLAVFGRRATMDTVLVDGDRVELLRPLVVDPKEARRRRAAKKRAASNRPVTCSSEPPAPAAC